MDDGAGAMRFVSRRVITSIDELVDPVATAQMRPMILRPGAVRAEFVSADLRGVLVSLLDYSFPLATRGQSLPDRVVLVVPLSRFPFAHMNGDLVVPEVAHAFGGLSEVSAVAGAASEFGTMSFDRDVLDQAARSLGVDIDVPDRGEYRAVPIASPARLRGLLVDIRQAVREMGAPGTSVLPAAAVADELVELVVGCLAADQGRATLTPLARLNSVRIVRICEDYAADVSSQGVTLRDLCTASGASERRVRHAFYECYDMSPTAYLRMVALNDVRHELLDQPPERDAVSRAACDHGFWHLSRFAGQYRALFGELPSDTVAHRWKTATG